MTEGTEQGDIRQSAAAAESVAAADPAAASAATHDAATLKRANKYFFAKVTFNAILIILGAVLIGLFLNQMQGKAALSKQEVSSRQALVEVVSTLEANAADAAELTRVFHDSNQDMLDDLHELFASGLFDSLAMADAETRAAVFADMTERTGVDYLFIMDDAGRVLLSPLDDFTGTDLVPAGLLTAENLAKLARGTLLADGSIDPAEEHNDNGYFFFYSVKISYQGVGYNLVLGSDGSTLDLQISTLKDVSAVLSRATVASEGFMFAVDRANGTYVYFDDGEAELTGTSASASGLSSSALEDGYAGIETINGVRYYCVSMEFGESTVVCAVADTAAIFASNRYVLFWSISGFVVMMLVCLVYAIVVRNDSIRNATVTTRREFALKGGRTLIFDKTIFSRIFPLMLVGVLVVFGISFYTQTLLEISQSIKKSDLALEEVMARYDESAVKRVAIQNYYNNRFLAKARLIAYLVEEDPSVLNEASDRLYIAYDDEGNRVYLLDDEGNRLSSVASSARLQELCDANDIDSIYFFDEDGRTIATNTVNWYFVISHDETAQSHPFLTVLDGRVDEYVQDPMVDDQGELAQFFGVAFTYYTAKDAAGNTVYVSRLLYEEQEAATKAALAAAGGTAGEGTVVADATDDAAEADAETTDGMDLDADAASAELQALLRTSGLATPISAHRSLMQIGLDSELTAQLMASTDVSYVLSSDLLDGGYIVLFDATDEHRCVYSPVTSRIGLTAAEIGVSDKAFAGGNYYGFTNIDGTTYFQYYRYADGYYVATSIPKASMYEARLVIALITALVSLILILLLSATVTFTSQEEEDLYATMSEAKAANRLDSTIFNIVLPSGKATATMKASERWSNRRIPWGEKSPDQKLISLLGIAGGLLVCYILITVLGVNLFFDEGSTISYILSGDWDRGLNVFALSACALVMVGVVIVVEILKVLVRMVSSLLGARGETVGHLLLSVVKYGGAIGALFYCLYLVGVDSTSLLASAGVLTLVIGLGAQSLIKDIIAGIFIVFEGEFRVGDIVTIDGYRGIVLDIGLRTTKILGPPNTPVEGNIMIYNNSDITGVLNMTKEASLATTYIQINYGEDIEYVKDVLTRELPALQENPLVLDCPQLLGVQELGDSGVLLYIACRCHEIDINAVRRYVNGEVLKIFYRNGIGVPYPHVSLTYNDSAVPQE